MKAKKLFFLIFIILIISGLLILWFIKNWDWGPREVVVANIRSQEAVVTFFTNKPVKSCVLVIGLLAWPRLICQDQALNSHYIQLEKLTPGKTYGLLLWQNGLPFTFYWQKKIISPKIEGSLPSPEKLEPPKTIFVRKLLPGIKLLDKDEDKEPLIINGHINSQQTKTTFVYFINLLDGGTIATTNNFQNNFIADIKSLMPCERIQIIAKNEDKEVSYTLSLDELFKGELLLQM